MTLRLELVHQGATIIPKPDTADDMQDSALNRRDAFFGSRYTTAYS